MNLNELQLISRIKEKPYLYFGRRSLVGLRDFLFGVRVGANAAPERPGEAVTALPYYHAFIDEYSKALWQREGRNGYVCWWNHMLYVAGGSDATAFDVFFHAFERWLREERGAALPAVDYSLSLYPPDGPERKE